MNSKNFKKEPFRLPDENSGQTTKIFIKTIEEKYNLKFSDYWEFHKWTTDNIADFWAEFWDFAGFIYSKPYDKVLDLNVPMEESPKWFEGARLNFAENLLKFRDERTALILAGEERKVIEHVSFKQLYEETRIYAAALTKIGLKEGDRVACYISNRKETVVAMLAVTSIGAIFTGALPTLGSTACINRLKQVDPKILFTIDQFRHGNENYELLENIKEITLGLPSLEKVIIVPSKEESKLKDISGIRNSCFLDEFLKLAYGKDGTLPELVFNQVSFSHPVFINYTSGTSGLPKSIVHGFGGLLNGIMYLWLHSEAQKDDVWLLMCTIGWIRWNLVIQSLFLGSTVVLYEGVPFFVRPTNLWDVVDKFSVTRMFLSPSVMDELESRNYLPTPNHNLKSLQMILSGGSVVKPNNYFFTQNKIKKGLKCLAVYGFTEAMGFCLVTDQTLPQYLGEIPSSIFGTAIECLDDEGNHVVGEVGEFAIVKPVPSFPVKMWNDSNGELYKKSYFSKFSGKFTIGDSVIINPITKGIIICGRSDETLKQRGTRFGSSEIYNVVKLLPEIKDSLCVGQYSKDREQRAVLFIKMNDGYFFNDELIDRLRKSITKELTENHIPEVILEVPAIPFNANGKKMELTIKKLINKLPFNPDSVANAECLQFYSNIPELEGF